MQLLGGQEKGCCRQSWCNHTHRDSNSTFVAKWIDQVDYSDLHQGCDPHVHGQEIGDCTEGDWKLCWWEWHFELTCGTSCLAFGSSCAAHEFADLICVVAYC